MKVVFAQMDESKTSVIATSNGIPINIAYSLKVVNQPIYEALGGKRIMDIKHFQVDFSSEKNAKKFIKTAKTSLSEEDLAAARRTAPKEDIVLPLPEKIVGRESDNYADVIMETKKAGGIVTEKRYGNFTHSTMIDKSKIIEILKKHPNGLKAKDIARLISGADRKVINQILYSNKDCFSINDCIWTLATDKKMN